MSKESEASEHEIVKTSGFSNKKSASQQGIFRKQTELILKAPVLQTNKTIHTVFHMFIFTYVSSSKLTRKVQKVKENSQTFPEAALMFQWQQDQIITQIPRIKSSTVSTDALQIRSLYYRTGTEN